MYALAFIKEIVSLDSAIGWVRLWADIGRNCNTFLYAKVLQMTSSDKEKSLHLVRTLPIFNFNGLGQIFYGCIDFFLIHINFRIFSIKTWLMPGRTTRMLNPIFYYIRLKSKLNVNVLWSVYITLNNGST